MLNDLLESQRREKSLTCLRRAQRELKNSGSCLETPSAPVVSHNNRRIQKFLQRKESDLTPNSFISRLFVGCCSPKGDVIFDFLTLRCHLDELTAMALVPVIRAIKNMLTSKIAIGISLSVLAYYLAKYVHLPVIVFAPIVALILSYLSSDITKKAVDAVVALYHTMHDAFEKAQEDITHISDVEVTQDSFKYIDSEIVEFFLIANYETPSWRLQAVNFCMHHSVSTNRRPFCIRVPTHIHRILTKVDETKLDPRFLQDLLAELRPNSLHDICVNITTQIKSLFSAVGLISDTLALPSAIFFYSSTKKFVSQIYSIFQDLYPFIYEFLTGKKYIDPQVAKYLAIFGDICKKVQETLKKSRQSNIVKEDATFRLAVILQYEELQES